MKSRNLNIQRLRNEGDFYSKIREIRSLVRRNKKCRGRNLDKCVVKVLNDMAGVKPENY